MRTPIDRPSGCWGGEGVSGADDEYRIDKLGGRS